MTRLLVINYHFPPDGSVGGLRWAALAKYLARDGWDVHVLTGASSATARAPGVQVHECPRLRTLNDAYRRFARAHDREAAGMEQTGTQTRDVAAEGPLTFVRRELASLLSFPDESRGWTLRAGLRARALRRRLRPDVVVTSGPPHSAHLAGLLAVWGSDVPLVVDLRDPWANQSRAWQEDPIYGRHVARVLVRRQERAVLRRARGVVVNTRPLGAALRARYPGLAIEWISNGADPERLVVPPGEPFPGLSVAHVGTLYGGRDPTPVVQAFARVLQRRPDLVAQGSKLRFAGHIEPRHRRALDAAVGEHGLAPHVEILGPLPPGEALAVLGRSRVALVMAQDQELQVPAKLFEAVALGKRTLAITDRDSATAAEAERLGVPWAEPAAVERIAAALETLGADASPPAAASTGSIGYGVLARQMAAFLHTVALARSSPALRTRANGAPPVGSALHPAAAPRRVLYVDYSVGFGGATKSVALIADLLRDVDKFVVTSQEPHVIRTWYSGMRVIRFRRFANYRTYASIKARLNRLLGDGLLFTACLKLLAAFDLAASVLNAVRMVALIRRHRIDCVHLSNGFLPLEGLLAPHWAGVPCIVHMRGMARERGKGLQARALRWVTCTIADSNAVADTARRVLGQRDVTTIYEPVDVARFDAAEPQRSEVRRRLGFEDGAVVVGIFGRVVRWKGQLEFVRASAAAMGRNPSLRALIVGDESDGGSEYFAEVRAAIAASGWANRFVLAGYQPAVEGFYHACDIVVHASIEPEPFGMVVTEAMAARRPVIASAAGGPCEVVDNGVDGLLVPPGDVAALADAIVALGDDAALRQAMGERGRAKVARAFDVAHIAEQVAAVYRRILSDRAASGRRGGTPDGTLPG